MKRRQSKEVTTIEKFSPEVCKELGYYVYRLIDPRDGSTFYIGKGQNNRVFDHIAQALRSHSGKGVCEAEITAKHKQINEIHKAGLKVITVIHRHHIESDDVAFQIEGALIDAYPGLTNIQEGHGNSEFGCANTAELQRILSAEEAKLETGKYIIIKIRKEVIDARGSVYEAVRKSWRINPRKAKDRLVIASNYGVIVGVFKAKWSKDPSESERYLFVGEEVKEENDLRGKRIPKKFIKKGAASPIRYT